MISNLITFALVVAAFYGVLWLVSQIEEKFGRSSKAALPKHRYKFYDSEEPRGASDPIVINVAGVTFEGRQALIRKLRVNDMLELVQELDNPHDQNAIKIVTKEGEQAGYVPRDLAADLSWVFKASRFTRPAKVLEVVGDESKGQSLGLIIQIYPPTFEEAIASSNERYPPF